MSPYLDQPLRAAPDFHLSNHGTIWLLSPMSDAGQSWCAENLPDALYHGGAIAIEARYIADIRQAIVDDGLTFYA